MSRRTPQPNRTPGERIAAADETIRGRVHSFRNNGRGMARTHGRKIRFQLEASPDGDWLLVRSEGSSHRAVLDRRVGEQSVRTHGPVAGDDLQALARLAPRVKKVRERGKFFVPWR